MGKKFELLLIILSALVFGSCGIDTYIYMEPISADSVTWDALNKKISFTLPSGQIQNYFNEYIVYYRIYFSSTDKESLTIGIGDLSGISPQLYTDYYRINPYTTNSDSAPVLLQSLFENTMKYSKLTFGEQVVTTSQLSIINSAETPLDKNSSGNLVVIDFNLKASNIIHPILSISGNNNRILRTEVQGLVPSRDFIYSSNMAGEDVDGISNSYSYVAFYIVAKGTDDSGSLVLSTATFLGVLQIPE